MFEFKAEVWEEREEFGKEWFGKEMVWKERGDLLREVRTTFLEVLPSDPFLPRELLPDSWVGERVKELLKKISSSI